MTEPYRFAHNTTKPEPFKLDTDDLYVCCKYAKRYHLEVFDSALVLHLAVEQAFIVADIAIFNARCKR